ncbi:RcpC/CpaB family pilus assembly protein [Streptomyces sp. WAC 01529]|uniref:RcpC/CpaB family pilus assembly protein n=1 Tax=Streptomyces sp. WAC 01529 TaxID=2203205 RepID=UPI001F0B89C4|nr:RcpC/CpaB family pilus assembly protein [Streptomyces sp. WAC 01529]
MTQVPSQARPSDGCPVPHFSPVRVRGGHPRLRRLLRHRRRALAVGLAMTAATLAASAPGDADRPRGPAGAAERSREREASETVTAPVRIADAAAVGLLRPGDRVDVVAAEASPGSGAKPRVVATGARVSEVPEQAEGPAESGALVVLSVPRDTAARLAGAGASARLAVTLR